MNKPYIVCHMMTSVDGRIDCAMTEHLPGVQEYYDTLDALDAPTRISGRVTAELEMALPGKFEAKTAEALGKEAFSKAADAEGYEIVVDTHGTLLWGESAEDERPLLILTSEQVSKEYLAYLNGKHISWIACGKEHVDLKRACEILAAEFDVKRAAAVGGGHINAGFLAAGLLDEVSILIGAGHRRPRRHAERVRRPADGARRHAAQAHERAAVRQRRGLAALQCGKLKQRSLFNMKYENKEAFEQVNMFGTGTPNTAYAKFFIGDSFLNPLTDPKGSLFAANVTFEPACRNNWHIHHATSGGGQLLLCTAGEGWYQEEGKDAVSLHEGSVIMIPANVKHWHGAKKDSWFSHIAVEVPGKNCRNEWCEPVSDEEYNKL